MLFYIALWQCLASFVASTRRLSLDHDKIHPRWDREYTTCLPTPVIPNTPGKGYGINVKVTVLGEQYESAEVKVTRLNYQIDKCYQCYLDGGNLHDVGHASWRNLTSGQVYHACATDDLKRKLTVWLEFIEYDISG